MQKNEIYVIYGEDMISMTTELLDAADLASHIPADAHIGIKPNLVGAIPAEKGATTHPQIVEALILYLQKHGFRDIVILEGSWVGDRTAKAFRVLGYEALSKKYHIPLIDTQKDRYIIKSSHGIDMEISEAALSLDYLINVPVLKGHCQTKITGALKNLKGLISDREKRHFHTLGLHEPIAYLNEIITADFILGDGICGDLEFEEGGNPIAMNRIFCGSDPVLVDSYIAQTMGYEPDDIHYITIADQIGVGSKDIQSANIHELNKDTSKVKPSASRHVDRLAEYITEQDACSACYANLIQALARLEDQGQLSSFSKGAFHIGQGFRQKEAPNKGCIGIGNCTKNYPLSLRGCPVKAADILSELRRCR